MEVYLLETPEFKIDGGAFFGVVPKTMWSKKYPADENNMCKVACRSLLIKDADKLILVDNGIGEKQNSKNQDLYLVDFAGDLVSNIENLGYTTDDITDLILTHLHFDHCGGTTKIDKNTNKHVPVFKNATHYISKKQWDNALAPNYREKSSYNKEKFEFLKDTNKLKLIEQNTNITPNIELRIFNGHTPGLMLPVVNFKNKTLFFTGDLIPAKASIPLAWVSAYDLLPAISMQEKEEILAEAEKNNWIFVFQHDLYNECCDLCLTNRGVRGNKTFKFSEIIKNEK